jgi:hypothetical protein
MLSNKSLVVAGLDSSSNNGSSAKFAGDLFWRNAPQLCDGKGPSAKRFAINLCSLTYLGVVNHLSFTF